jgi:hypothetical protein
MSGFIGLLGYGVLSLVLPRGSVVTLVWRSCLTFQLGPSTFFSMIPLVDGPSVPAD